jgi:hypothetical protein
MACHKPAERAEIAGTGARTAYNLHVFNILVFFESHQVHQIPQRLTKTERPKCVFWSPNGVQKWTPATWLRDQQQLVEIDPPIPGSSLLLIKPDKPDKSGLSC